MADQLAPFLFGLLLLEAMPFLVEVGVLLDLFTGVFVMGIIIHHISREFASIRRRDVADLLDEIGPRPRAALQLGDAPDERVQLRRDLGAELRE